MARFDYFISYAHDDRAWAAWLAWQLESLGYRVVLDRWDLRPGDEFAGKLMELIQDSSNVIALLSKNYLSSSFTQSEWLPLIIRGPVEGPGVVPVRIDDVKTPLLLRENVGVSLVGLDSKSAAVRITESSDRRVCDLARRRRLRFLSEIRAEVCRSSAKDEGGSS